MTNTQNINNLVTDIVKTIDEDTYLVALGSGLSNHEAFELSTTSDWHLSEDEPAVEDTSSFDDYLEVVNA